MKTIEIPSATMPRGCPSRGVIGSAAAIAKIAKDLPDGTPVIVSSYCPAGDQVYILRDPELAAFLRFVGAGRKP